MKRRKPTPDKRLNWRDKNMPVLRMARASENEPFTLQPLNPIAVQQWHEYKMATSDFRPQEPDWRNDPTYDLRRKR